MTDVAKIADRADMENDIGSSLTAVPRAGDIAALVASQSCLTADAAQIRRSLRRRCGLVRRQRWLRAGDFTNRRPKPALAVRQQRGAYK